MGALPITVVAVWTLAWLLASNGIRYEEVFGYGISLTNPAEYTLTLLTNNCHVLLIIFCSQFLAQISQSQPVSSWSGSPVQLGVMAALLVRTTGIAFQNSSDEMLQNAVAGMLTLTGMALLLIAIVAGPNHTIAHFGHLFGFLFGGAIESIYVFNAYTGTDESDERTVSKYVGR